MTRIITLTIIFALFAFGGCDDKRLGPEHPGHNNGSGDVQEETTLCELVDAVRRSLVGHGKRREPWPPGRNTGRAQRC